MRFAASLSIFLLSLVSHCAAVTFVSNMYPTSEAPLFLAHLNRRLAAAGSKETVSMNELLVRGKFSAAGELENPLAEHILSLKGEITGLPQGALEKGVFGSSEGCDAWGCPLRSSDLGELSIVFQNAVAGGYPRVEVPLNKYYLNPFDQNTCGLGSITGITTGGLFLAFPFFEPGSAVVITWREPGRKSKIIFRGQLYQVGKAPDAQTCKPENDGLCGVDGNASSQLCTRSCPVQTECDAEGTHLVPGPSCFCKPGWLPKYA